jgi:hypothetical protein
MAAGELRVQVFGARKLSSQLLAKGKEIRKTTFKVLTPAAFLMVREIQLQMKGSRTRSKRKGRAVTSPRRKLGIDTGHLRRSIGSRGRGGVFKKGRTLRGNAYIEFGTSVVYGLVHEEGRVIPMPGGRGSIRMPRRPFFTPGIRKALPAVRRMVAGVLRLRI